MAIFGLKHAYLEVSCLWIDRAPPFDPGMTVTTSALAAHHSPSSPRHSTLAQRRRCPAAAISTRRDMDADPTSAGAGKLIEIDHLRAHAQRVRHRCDSRLPKACATRLRSGGRGSPSPVLTQIGSPGRSVGDLTGDRSEAEVEQLCMERVLRRLRRACRWAQASSSVASRARRRQGRS